MGAGAVVVRDGMGRGISVSVLARVNLWQCGDEKKSCEVLCGVIDRFLSLPERNMIAFTRHFSIYIL